LSDNGNRNHQEKQTHRLQISKVVTTGLNRKNKLTKEETIVQKKEVKKFVVAVAEYSTH